MHVLFFFWLHHLIGRWPWVLYSKYVLSKFLCWNLFPRVLIHGGGALGRWLGYKDRTIMNEISDLVKENQRTPFPLLSFEDTAKRWLSLNQEAGPHQTLNMMVPWSFPSLPVKIKFVLWATHSMAFYYGRLNRFKTLARCSVFLSLIPHLENKIKTPFFCVLFKMKGYIIHRITYAEEISNENFAPSII